jgi:ADP-heptose:LPS heptosyltransferase
MGIGDQLIASGLAREAWTKRGVKIAFGHSGRVIWDKHSSEIFQNNPNVCFPGNEGKQKVEWVPFYKGNRLYNKSGGTHWVWNPDWKSVPGEIYLTHGEKVAGDRAGKDFILIEPNVVRWKSSAANKDWGHHNYQAVANKIVKAGKDVAQFVHGESGPLLYGVRTIKTRNFRDATAVLRNARLYLGSEGGLHHAAAAFDVPGVVLFGGFIPPSVTGYDVHTNLTGSDRFCGSFKPCKHCREAMDSISADRVFDAAMERLGG